MLTTAASTTTVIQEKNTRGVKEVTVCPLTPCPIFYSDIFGIPIPQQVQITMIATHNYNTENYKDFYRKTCNYCTSDSNNNSNYDFFTAIEKQANAQFQTLMKTHYPIISKSAVIEHYWPVKPHNYSWCRYCDKKEQIIVFQFVERFRILHTNSFFQFLAYRNMTSAGMTAANVYSYGRSIALYASSAFWLYQ
jgi:hypothetical protein